MKFNIVGHSYDSVVSNTGRQASRIFNEEIAAAAASGAPFQNVGAIYILQSVYAIKSLAGPPGHKNRGAYRKADNTYSIWSNVDFDAFASGGWDSRIKALADAARRTVAAIAKTRVAPEEREQLLKWIAEGEAAALLREPTELETFNEAARAGFPDSVMALDPEPARHVRLYKIVEGERHYREAWLEEQRLISHEGIVGTDGNTVVTPIIDDAARLDALKHFAKSAKFEEYRPIPLSQMTRLMVEYASEFVPHRTDVADVEKLHQTLDQILGWTGLGHCDGGSSGSGTAELCCFVVDYKLAKSVIEARLPAAGWTRPVRIYRES